MIAVAAFGTSLGAQVLVALVSSLGKPAARTGSDSPGSLTLSALFVQLALGGLVAVLLKKHVVLRRRAWVFHRATLPMLAAGVILIFGLAPIANDLGFRLSETINSGPDTTRWVALLIHRATWAELLMVGVTLTLLPACVEELLFRGLLLGALSFAPRFVAIALQAAAFGLFHMDWAQGAATFVLGLGFGYLRVASGSLVPSMLAHALYNLVVLLTMRFTDVTLDGSTHESPLALGVSLLVVLASGMVLESNYQKSLREAGASSR